MNFKGWNSQAQREFPGKFESSNIIRDNVSREIGRTLEKPTNKEPNSNLMQTSTGLRRVASAEDDILCPVRLTLANIAFVCTTYAFYPKSMHGCYGHFNNLRFRISQHINSHSAAHVLIGFVSSELMTCRLLN